MDVGKRILQLLEEKQWTVYRLHQEINKNDKIGSSTLSQIITGKKPNPTQKTIQKICTALGISIAKFNENEEKNNFSKNKKMAAEMLPYVLEELDSMDDLGEDGKAALELIKNTSLKDLEEMLSEELSLAKKIKRLSVKHQEAITTIIDSLSSSEK